MCVETSGFTNVCSQIKKRKTNFHPIEVVDRGSETQLQLGENSNNLSRQDKD